MRGFDFGQIGDIVSNVMDTDYIDIKRNVNGSLVEMYSNVPCHIAYMSVDNPDPLNVDVKPIIQGMTIHVPLWVDVRNDDFIIAKKMDSNGNAAGIYSGRCGNPVVSQGRKKVMVQMLGTEPYEPTPVPPIDPVTITISYLHSQDKIHEDVVESVEKGEDFVANALSIEGFEASYYLLDDVRGEGDTCVIEDVQVSHTLVFVYEESEESTSYAFLVNGLYTRNDGTLANGWHSYKTLPINSLSKQDDVYTISVDDLTLEHEDNGKILTIKAGQPIVIFPSQKTLMIGNATRNEGIVTFSAMEFTPEYPYYRTRWYDK